MHFSFFQIGSLLGANNRGRETLGEYMLPSKSQEIRSVTFNACFLKDSSSLTLSSLFFLLLLKRLLSFAIINESFKVLLSLSLLLFKDVYLFISNALVFP